jgi:hypothetical protein
MSTTVLPGTTPAVLSPHDVLLSRAGFRMTRILPTKSPLSVIEGLVER